MTTEEKTTDKKTVCCPTCGYEGQESCGIVQLRDLTLHMRHECGFTREPPMDTLKKRFGFREDTRRRRLS